MSLSSTLALLLSLAQAPAQAAPIAAQQDATEAARRIVATLQLAAQEYRLAWVGGSLTKPEEAHEARLFVAEARRSGRDLPVPLSRDVDALIAGIERLLVASAPAESVAVRTADIERRLTVAFGVSLDERPSREPSLANGELFYNSTCTRCHGLEGRGDGPVARRLTPPPADLTDSTILAATTPLDLYRKLSLGVPGTRMPAYDEILSREERWDVVAYVLTLSDSSARRSRKASLAIVFGTVRGELGGAVDLARRGERQAASRKVFDGYLAFEAVEGALRPTEPSLVSRAERRFAALREATATGAPAAETERRHAELLTTLAEAEDALTRTRSATALLAESFLLMVREGFEAILVIAAIMAVLIKSGAEARRKSVREGVLAAVAASLLTAALLEWVFIITPARREALEGGVMLLAAGMLFYVSYWLISKIEVAAWQRFVKGKIQKAVESGNGLALAAVAFLAVYREGFETVLFYKALFVTGGAGGAAPITIGIIAGSVVLLVLFLGIEKFGLRIPMRPFFAVTSMTLYFMAFVFAGTGVKELQEGSIVSTTLVPSGPRNEFLGIYPTVEGLAVQGVILVALVIALVWTFVVRPRRARVEEAPKVAPAAKAKEKAAV
ncbi:MAG: cytochrome c/FTR1 family iron permease [Gemmatimonadales bacterium]|nr:cytochrome c/FTR1 family iron permease [Gemmatimonadales bacterium]